MTPFDALETAMIPRRAAVQLAMSEVAVQSALGGAVLALVEMVLVAPRAALAPVDFALYAWTSFAIGAAAVLVVLAAARPFAGGRSARPRREAVIATAALALGAGAWLGWELTSGRRLASLPMRPFLVAASALLPALAAVGLVVVAARARRTKSRAARIVTGLILFNIAAALMWADARFMVRLYPPIHFAFAAGAILAAASASHALIRFVTQPWAVIALIAPVSLAAALPITTAVNGRKHAIAEHAPLTGKLVGVTRGAPSARRPTPAPTRPAIATDGLDLRGRDILLITVDALRADALGAYGGLVPTPHLDALARHGAKFTHAYTVTPHTSYALGSLFTGKFLRPVLGLRGGARNDATLAGELRRAGYQTASFYPPAVFYVDPEELRELKESALGFERHTERFASGVERVNEVRAFLASARRDAPVFVWVHLFEPHEPYEPPAGLAAGSSHRELYDGEVRVADTAVGALVDAFRAARANSTVIVTADHGEEFGEHGGAYHGTTLYEEQIRVPLIWSSPGAVPPRSVEAPVEIIDITTTILAALGVPRHASMTGDDLGPVLRSGQGGPEHAFAGLEQSWAVIGTRHKAICSAGADSVCRVVDLLEDPHERRDIAPDAPAVEAGLAGALATLLGTISQAERNERDGGEPAALTRARIGDRTAAPNLVPLLIDERAPMRAAAARALGELRHRPALAVLARTHETDADPCVRAEAALAAATLGDGPARAGTQRLISAPDAACSPELPRRAAAILAELGDASGALLLEAWSKDTNASLETRRHAVVLLGALRARHAVPTLIELLADESLRIATAEALGAIGDRRAARALLASLQDETHIPARAAEARVLVQLREPRVEPLVRAYLRETSPLPGGLGLLVQMGALNGRRDDLAFELTRVAQVREGEWTCSRSGCTPGAGALLRVNTVDAPHRVLVLVRAARDGELRIAGSVAHVATGEHELMFDATTASLSVAATEGVTLVAAARLPAVAPQVAAERR